MDSNKIGNALTITIIAFFLVGLFTCGFWFPWQTGLIKTDGIAPNMTGSPIGELSTYWLESVPFFVVLVIAINSFKTLSKDGLFSRPLAKRIKTAGWVILCDSLAFFASNMVFAFIGGPGMPYFYLALGVIGISFGWVMVAASSVLYEAIREKEENEAIV